MKTIDRSITDIINTEYLEYSMYVLEQRAIPSVCDGFKNVHRKLVYAMLTEHAGKKVKLADLSGISKFNYHHGESSAAGAAVTLTADWNNNCPVFTGHGNFGSRLVQEAAAARYIFASLSPEFKKYFIDFEIAPKSSDLENPEPAHYLPIIPWVLINGISGIAVGFACNVLPHSIADVTSAVKSYLKNPKQFVTKNAPIIPTFPHFRGTVEMESDDGKSWSTQGIVEYIGKFSYQISELPVGYDREQYVNVLNNLVDSDKIRDYEDNCDENGFGFTVKVSGAQKEKIDQDPIKFFKLKKIHSENITTLGIDGKLKIFSSVAELIAYFCDYRLKKFDDKLVYERNQLNVQISEMTDRIKFIELVIAGKVDFKKLSKQQLLTFIEEKITKEQHGKQLINLPVYKCTTDEIEALRRASNECSKELTILESTSALKRFNEVLK